MHYRHRPLLARGVESSGTDSKHNDIQPAKHCLVRLPTSERIGTESNGTAVVPRQNRLVIWLTLLMHGGSEQTSATSLGRQAIVGLICHIPATKLDNRSSPWLSFYLRRSSSRAVNQANASVWQRVVPNLLPKRQVATHFPQVAWHHRATRIHILTRRGRSTLTSGWTNSKPRCKG